MPLREELLTIGNSTVEWFRNRQESPSSTDVAPYHVYVYPPDREWEVRRDVNVDLAGWLDARSPRIPYLSISLAELFWDAIDGSGFADELFAQERETADSPAAQAEVHRGVAELLRRPTPFSTRVLDAIRARSTGDAAVFLYRAGALFPSFRTSGLLEDLRSHLPVPVTLLYPGKLYGDFGLSFMGKWDPTYTYRATIVDGTKR